MPFVNIHSAFEIKCMNHINMILQEFKLYDMHPSLSRKLNILFKIYIITSLNKWNKRKLQTSAPSFEYPCQTWNKVSSNMWVFPRLSNNIVKLLDLIGCKLYSHASWYLKWCKCRKFSRKEFEIRNCDQNDQNTPNYKVTPLKSGFFEGKLGKLRFWNSNWIKWWWNAW